MVELVDTVQHPGPGLDVRRALGQVADSTGIVEAVGQFTFQTEAVCPLIADGKRFAQIAFALNFAIQRAGNIGIARSAVTQRTTNVPALLSKRRWRS